MGNVYFYPFVTEKQQIFVYKILFSGNFKELNSLLFIIYEFGFLLPSRALRGVRQKKLVGTTYARSYMNILARSSTVTWIRKMRRMAITFIKYNFIRRHKFLIQVTKVKSHYYIYLIPINFSILQIFSLYKQRPVPEKPRRVS